MPVHVVWGAQFGSEGKGRVVYDLFSQHETTTNRKLVAVRVGGPNAGHTVWKDGHKLVFRQLPSLAAVPHAHLFLGPGAVFSVSLLLDEIAMCESSGCAKILPRLHIDTRAILLQDHHHASEGGIYGDLHTRIGSTGEGVGAARVGHITRVNNGSTLHAGTHDGLLPEQVASRVVNRDYLVTLNTAAAAPDIVDVVIEGTQGYGLNPTTGPWPFCTSADVGPAALLSQSGLSPLALKSSIAVVRTFPIRVAGNSGPLSNETTWERLSQSLGRHITETTTVTKLTRRVGFFDDEQTREACVCGGATGIWVNFVDYLVPSAHRVTFEKIQSSTSVHAFFERLVRVTGRPIVGYGYSPTEHQTIQSPLVSQ